MTPAPHLLTLDSGTVITAELSDGDAVFLHFRHVGASRKLWYVPKRGFIHDNHPIPEMQFIDREKLNHAIHLHRDYIPTTETRHQDRVEIVNTILKDLSCKRGQVGYTYGSEWSWPIKVFTPRPLSVEEQARIKKEFKDQDLAMSLHGPEREPAVQFFSYTHYEANND